MRHLYRYVLALVAIFLLAGSAQADLITNGSFEDGPDPGVSRITLGVGGGITGWSVTAGQVDYMGPVWQASDLVRSFDMAGDVPGAIATSFATTRGVTYKITFDLAGNFWADAPGPMRLEVSAAGTTQTYDSLRPAGWNLGNMGWIPKTFLFTADDALTTLEFKAIFVPEANLANGDPNYFAGHGPALDNVQGSPVPLPGTLLLLGSGLLGLVLCRKRRAGEPLRSFLTRLTLSDKAREGWERRPRRAPAGC